MTCREPAGTGRFITAALLLCFAAGTAMAAGPGDCRGLVRGLLRKAPAAGGKIAVADFNYADGRVSADGEVLAGRITTELVELEKYKVAERREIEKVFAELKLQGSGAIGTDSIKDIGALLGADWLILGTLTELSRGRIEVNARLVEVSSGEIIGARRVKLRKDWRDKPAAGEKGENSFNEGTELKEYDKAIRTYMDKKAGSERRVVKEPPPSF